MTVRGLRLHARDTGDPAVADGDVPVVLIHGLGMSSASYRRLIPELSASTRLIALDLPGCGRSDRPNTITLDDVVDLMWVWLDELKVPRARLVGHSLGAQLVTYMALAQPDRVQDLVMLAPCPDPTARGWRAPLRLLADSVHEPWGLIGLAIVEYLRARPRRMWAVYKKALSSGDVDVLRRITVPVLVIVGELDRVSGRGARDLLEAHLPRRRIITVPGGTHGLPYQSPREVAAAIRETGGRNPTLGET